MKYIIQRIELSFSYRFVYSSHIPLFSHVDSKPVVILKNCITFCSHSDSCAESILNFLLFPQSIITFCQLLQNAATVVYCN